MQASRRSGKAHQGSDSIGSSLSTGFQVYLSKRWNLYVGPSYAIRLAFCWVFLSCFCMLILSLPLFGLASNSTFLSPGFFVGRPRQYYTICQRLNLISGFFVFSWLIFLGIWNQQMWLVSCKRQGMLTDALTFPVVLSRWLKQDDCCVCFFVFPFFFVSGSFN